LKDIFLFTPIGVEKHIRYKYLWGNEDSVEKIIKVTKGKLEEY